MKNLLHTRCVRLVGALLAMTALASCATKKPMAESQQPVVVTPAVQTAEADARFLHTVLASAADVENLTSKIDFTLTTGTKTIPVGGKLQMRRDEVIRIQLLVPLLGMEAGRMEFTKDDVLILDRIHGEYVRADYNEVDFLRDNGLNFNSLQSLFWNRLFVPGQMSVGENDLTSFHVGDAADKERTITLVRDRMSYQWQAESQSGLIRKADISYESQKHGNTHVSCNYDDFRALGSGKFPASIVIDLQTTATKKPKQFKMGLQLKNFSTDNKWESRTTVSKKYKAVSVDDVLAKLSAL